MDSGSAAAVGLGAGFTIVYVLILVLLLASMWRVFDKAGQPGWAAIVPIYNIYVLCEIAGKPGWWLILMFIPVVNIVIAIMVTLALAEAFDMGTGFAIGLILLPIVFLPILAFGDAQYGGKSATPGPNVLSQ